MLQEEDGESSHVAWWRGAQARSVPCPPTSFTRPSCQTLPSPSRQPGNAHTHFRQLSQTQPHTPHTPNTKLRLWKILEAWAADLTGGLASPGPVSLGCVGLNTCGALPNQGTQVKTATKHTHSRSAGMYHLLCLPISKTWHWTVSLEWRSPKEASSISTATHLLFYVNLFNSFTIDVQLIQL